MDSFRRGIAAQVTDRLPRPVRRGLRVVLLALLVVILLFGLFRAAAPFLVQTAVVRTGIERAIAQWTGHDVTIEGSPTIIFWPQPRIEVDRVTVSKASPDGVRLLSRTRKLSAEFSLYQALRGRAVFEDFRLIEPEIFVTRDEEGRLDWAEDGLLSEATRNVAASGPQRVLDPMLDRRVGDIAVENGRIEIEDAKSGRAGRRPGSSTEPFLARTACPAFRRQCPGRRRPCVGPCLRKISRVGSPCTLRLRLRIACPFLIRRGSAGRLDGKRHAPVPFDEGICAECANHHDR